MSSASRAAPRHPPPPRPSSTMWAFPVATSDPDLSPTTNFHTASPTPLSADDVDPLPADLPTTVSITSPLSLSEEFLRLSLLLSSTSSHWQLRVHSLQCISEIVRHEDWVKFENLMPLLDRYRLLLVAQLVDRRSAVVKQACSTIAAVSTALKGLLLDKASTSTSTSSASSSSSSSSSASLENPHRIWLSLTCHWIDHLIPNIPVTIKVISEATSQCFHTVLNNIATLQPPMITTDAAQQSYDYTLLESLMSACQHKHATVREHCYRGLAHLLAHLPQSCLALEREKDEAEAASISQAVLAYKQLSASLSEPSSPLPFTVNPTPAGSILLHNVEVCVHRGIHDSDARVRGASRAALLEFADRCSTQRGDRVVMTLPISSQKMLEKERQDRIIAATTTSTAPTSASTQPKLSVRERLRQQQKKKPEVAAKTITHSTTSPRSGRKGSNSNSGSSSPVRARSIEYSMGPFLPSAGPEVEEDVVVGVGVMEDVKVQADEEEMVQGRKNEPVIEKDVAVSAVSDMRNRNAMLLCRLLDLESPMLTEKMQSYLMQDGVMETMLQFVTQVPAGFDFDNIDLQPPHLLPASSSNSRPLSSPSPLRRRPSPSTEDEHIASKRSYNVMTLLCQPRPSPSLVAILIAKLPVLLSRLLCGFLPCSNANLYHTCAILSHLFTLSSSQPLSVLMSSPLLCSLFLLTFDHLHEGPVPALILTMMTAGEDKERKKQLIAASRRQDILGVLTSRICQPLRRSEGEEGEGEEGRCLACIDFIDQVVEKVSSAEYLTSFLATIADPNGLVSHLIDLVSAPSSPSHPSSQLSAASALLFSLISSTADSQILISDNPSSSASSSSALSEMSLFNKRKVSNPLFALKAKLVMQLRQRLPLLCSVLLRDEASDAGDVRFSGGYSVRCFSSRRMGVLRVVAAVCRMDPDSCASLGRPVWDRLVDWMFLYRHNNFVLSAFSSLLVLLLHAVPDSPLQTETLRYVLVDLKLVSRMIAAYHHMEGGRSGVMETAASPSVSSSSSSTALDSTILIICSHLRLTASLHPASSFLFSHLSSHSQWRQFLPLLTQETTLQSRYHPLPESDDSAFMRALQSFSSSLPPPSSSSATKGGDGIDIGSRFAIALGYDEAVGAVVVKGGAAGRKGKKKKNKAKKRAKKALEEMSGDGDDGEGDDDDQDGESETEMQSGTGSGVEEEKMDGTNPKESNPAVISSMR